MSLHSGVDTVAFVSYGTYTETYASVANQANMNNLFAFYGLLEDAPSETPAVPGALFHRFYYYFGKRQRRRRK
jgi:hypothetical protein